MHTFDFCYGSNTYIKEVSNTCLFSYLYEHFVFQNDKIIR